MSWIILSIHWINGTRYLDPGSGSFLLQLLIGVLMGGALAVKIYWRKIVAFFKKESPQPVEPVDDNSSISDDK